MPSAEQINHALSVHNSGDLKQAEVLYDKLLSESSDHDLNSYLISGYGCLLLQTGRLGLAKGLLQTAASMNPKHAPTWCNLGSAYKKIGFDGLALTALQKAYEIEPNGEEINTNLAGWYLNKDVPKRAEEYARRAMKANPDSSGGHYHLSLALMEQGRFDEAWEHWEYRWKREEGIKNARPYKAPLWTGEQVGTLAIHGEQGLGDEILFMSAFDSIGKKAKRIVVECAERLIPIFKETWPQIHFYPTHRHLIGQEGEPDAYIPMGSLWSVLGMPSGKPYLHRDFHPGSKPIIGLTWKGGVKETYTQFRSIKLKDLEPIYSIPGAQFVSLQYGGEEFDKEALAEGLLVVEGKKFTDLHAATRSCDLVITVCQTAVHSAGATGTPCWVMTPRRAAWRYRSENDRLSWYDSVRLYKQGEDDDWGPVIRNIVRDVENFIADRKSKAA